MSVQGGAKTMSTTNENVLFARSDAQNPTNAPVVPKSRQYLIFIINDSQRGDLKLGVDAESVVEILNSHTVTYLPMMPDYVPGIFNMRGQIIPVMDIRRRLGKDADKDGLLVVLNYNETQIGILVDAVDRMVDVPDELISAVPSQESQRFVSGICTIPDDSSTMMVLDCEQLLAHE